MFYRCCINVDPFFNPLAHVYVHVLIVLDDFILYNNGQGSCWLGSPWKIPAFPVPCFFVVFTRGSQRGRSDPAVPSRVRTMWSLATSQSVTGTDTDMKNISWWNCSSNCWLVLEVKARKWTTLAMRSQSRNSLKTASKMWTLPCSAVEGTKAKGK